VLGVSREPFLEVLDAGLRDVEARGHETIVLRPACGAELDDRLSSALWQAQLRGYFPAFKADTISASLLQMADVYFPHPRWGKYACNVQGRVMRIDKNKCIQGHLNTSGYIILTFYDGTKPRGRQSVHVGLHKFVWECFGRNIPGGHHVDHINGNKEDNSLSNLQCLSPQAHGLKTAQDNPGRGVKIALARRIPITRTAVTGEVVRYASLKEGVADTPRSSWTGISKASRSNGKVTHAGYKWAQAQAPTCDVDEVWASPREVKWRPLTVSSSGQVKLPKGPTTFGHDDGKGYLRVGHKRQKLYVHTLVCATFLGAKPDSDASVDHIDRCISNNHLSNLRWASKKEQAGNTKANKEIRAVRISDGQTFRWLGATAASRAVGVCVETVYRALRLGRQIKGFLLVLERSIPVKL